MADRDAGATWVINIFVVRSIVSDSLLSLSRSSPSLNCNKHDEVKKADSNSIPSSEVGKKTFFFPTSCLTENGPHTKAPRH